MDCCRDIGWCRCPCFSVLTSLREAKPKSVLEILSLIVMSHVHIHVLSVAKPLY